jgi:hypothetical protein
MLLYAGLGVLPSGDTFEETIFTSWRASCLHLKRKFARVLESNTPSSKRGWDS